MPDVQLPRRTKDGQEVLLEKLKSLVVVGANGSGKSRFGAWIERKAGYKAHRVSAQRGLSVPSIIQPRAYEQAEATLICGGYEPTWKPEQQAANKFGRRWNNEPTSYLLNDFEQVLAMLFADETKRSREYANKALKNVPKEHPPKCRLDKLGEIWASVIPHRRLSLEDDRVKASTTVGTPYDGREMSDGERVTIYLIGQCLCAPEGAIIIIDEAEIHLHRAIQASLWNQIELARPDCAFVYITHDLEFAASRTHAKRLWIRSFDGSEWEWEEIPHTPELPDQLLFELLGSRRPILFAEGDDAGYDAAVYAALYPDELVIPRSSCEKVIEATKAMASLNVLHHLQIGGIVDRDRRCDVEIQALRAAGLSVAEVAEVENLLCIPEALDAVALQLKCTEPTNRQEEAKAEVLREFGNSIERQALSRACRSAVSDSTGLGRKSVIWTQSHWSQKCKAICEGSKLAAPWLLLGLCSEMCSLGAIIQEHSSIIIVRGFWHSLRRPFQVSKEAYAQIVLGIIKEQPTGAVATAMKRLIDP